MRISFYVRIRISGVHHRVSRGKGRDLQGPVGKPVMINVRIPKYTIRTELLNLYLFSSRKSCQKTLVVLTRHRFDYVSCLHNSDARRSSSHQRYHVVERTCFVIFARTKHSVSGHPLYASAFAKYCFMVHARVLSTQCDGNRAYMNGAPFVMMPATCRPCPSILQNCEAPTKCHMHIFETTAT